jgi:hypothetical protein
MQWFGRKPIRKGEDWRDCFAWIPRKIEERADGSWLWIWLEPFSERCVEGVLIPMGSIWKFERRCASGSGTVTIYSDY